VYDVKPEVELADVQNSVDERGIELDRVGVTDLFYPLTIREKAGGTQVATCRLNIFVGLHAAQRGAHLSHLVEALDNYRSRVFSMDSLVHLLRDVRARQDEHGLAFETAELQIRFMYFLPKLAPASGLSGLVGYDCGFDVALNRPGHKSVIVNVPIAAVCPCSLEISDVGAHNQRGVVTIQVWQMLDDTQFIWFEDLIEVAEGAASGDVHSLLRRADEKVVTEKMFREPRFVEDVVRGVVSGLRSRLKGVRYRVESKHFESIHPHNSYAQTQGEC